MSNKTTKEKIQKVVEEATEEKITECSNNNIQIIKIITQIIFIKTYLKQNNYKKKKYGQSHFF